MTGCSLPPFSPQSEGPRRQPEPLAAVKRSCRAAACALLYHLVEPFYIRGYGDVIVTVTHMTAKINGSVVRVSKLGLQVSMAAWDDHDA